MRSGVPSQHAAKPVVDQIISARWVIPVRPRVLLHHHALAIKQGRIVAIGPRDEIHAAYTAAENTSLDHHVLMPGFVNAHTHAAMTLMRGLADDLPLMTWLNEHIWPVEGRFVSPEFVSMGTELAIAEMLRGGTTTFNDMYFFPKPPPKVLRTWVCVPTSGMSSLIFLRLMPQMPMLACKRPLIFFPACSKCR